MAVMHPSESSSGRKPFARALRSEGCHGDHQTLIDLTQAAPAASCSRYARSISSFARSLSPKAKYIIRKTVGTYVTRLRFFTELRQDFLRFFPLSCRAYACPRCARDDGLSLSSTALRYSAIASLSWPLTCNASPSADGEIKPGNPFRSFCVTG